MNEWEPKSKGSQEIPKWAHLHLHMLFLGLGLIYADAVQTWIFLRHFSLFIIFQATYYYY